MRKNMFLMNLAITSTALFGMNANQSFQHQKKKLFTSQPRNK